MCTYICIHVYNQYKWGHAIALRRITSVTQTAQSIHINMFMYTCIYLYMCIRYISLWSCYCSALGHTCLPYIHTITHIHTYFNAFYSSTMLQLFVQTHLSSEKPEAYVCMYVCMYTHTHIYTCIYNQDQCGHATALRTHTPVLRKARNK